jgi:hypothetical protein
MHCAIQLQLNKDSPDDDEDGASETETVQISLVERHPIIAEATLTSPPKERQ